MTPPGARRTTVVAATVLGCLLGTAGCGSGGGRDAAVPPPAPTATGTHPYPAPAEPGEAAPLPAGPAGTPEGDVPRPADVDREHADAVGRGALTVMWTYDTAVDSGPRAAGIRAADAGWLTEGYAARLRAHRPRSAPGAQWREWARHRARTVVVLHRAEDAARPADTGTEAWRQWTVTATPRGRDGWRGEPATVVTYVRLTRAAAGGAWRVADVTVP